MQVKIINGTIMAKTHNKVITITPKQGKHHDMHAIARIELGQMGFKRVSEWENNVAEFRRADGR